MKYNEKKKKRPKKTDAEIVVKLDKKVNDTNSVEYKFRSGIETFVHVPKRIWNRYPQKKPSLYYPKVSGVSYRRADYPRITPLSSRSRDS